MRKNKKKGIWKLLLHKGTIVKAWGYPVKLIDDTIVEGNPKNFITSKEIRINER